MKKWWFLLFVLVVFIFGCAKEKPKLSEFQVTACESAAANNNCAKLSDLGIKADQCCAALGKCCGGIVGKVIAWNGMLTAQSSLSDIQVAACQSANANSNCDKLSEIGIVSREDCCSALGLCCFGVSLDEFKSVLLQAIASYFSPNPTLTANELKDMINVYFASADVVDLSVVGGFSGERMIDIYNKAKGVSSTPTCFDGIQNQGETGVDCGGPCPACVVTQTCSSVGGSCKPDACSTYASCADLSSGQCDSGNCCSGSCTLQNCTLQIPPNAQPLSLDYRYYGLPFSPGERDFVVSVTNPKITRIRGQLLGLTGETDVTGTWIMPDCKEFMAYASGTDNAALLDIRSKNSIQPNIKYDYIPVGNHMFKVKANAPSLVIIWFTTY